MTPSTSDPETSKDQGSTLEDIFARQRQLQQDNFGGDPSLLPLEEKIQYIKDMTLALTDELHEALNEVGWKPWSTKKHINVPEFKGELIDALHFFVNLCIVVDMDPDEVFDRYFNKAKVNQKRQEEGYDNTNKCVHCKRALDEPEENHSPRLAGASVADTIIDQLNRSSRD